jgi:hypothetical protein
LEVIYCRPDCALCPTCFLPNPQWNCMCYYTKVYFNIIPTIHKKYRKQNKQPTKKLVSIKKSRTTASTNFFLKLIIWNIDIHTSLLDSIFLCPHLLLKQKKIRKSKGTTKNRKVRCVHIVNELISNISRQRPFLLTVFIRNREK